VAVRYLLSLTPSAQIKGDKILLSTFGRFVYDSLVGGDTQSPFFSFENKILESVFWLSLFVPMGEQNSEMDGP